MSDRARRRATVAGGAPEGVPSTEQSRSFNVLGAFRRCGAAKKLLAEAGEGLRRFRL
jgi:hypothetical protein